MTSADAGFPDFPWKDAEWDLIPEYMRGGLYRYIMQGIEPGSFMGAVLANDLVRACQCADAVNRHRLFDYVKFLTCWSPQNCWGSESAYGSWLRFGGLGINSPAAEEIETQGE